MMNTKSFIEEWDDRFQRASENLKRIEKKIAPFVKRADFKICSTSGKWHETSAWLRTKNEDGKGRNIRSGIPSGAAVNTTSE